MDTRPLPSLPRRPGNEDGVAVGGNYVAGSLKSNASGSDASLHWGDTPPRQDAMVATTRGGGRDNNVSFNGQMVPGFPQQQQQQQHCSWNPDHHLSRNGSVAAQEDDYLTPRTISSTATSAELRNPDGSPASGVHRSPPTVVDHNAARQWQLQQQHQHQHQQQQQQQQQQQVQQFWRQHPQLLARASFPVAMGTEDRQMPWDVADPSNQTMPRVVQSATGGGGVQINSGVAAGHTGGHPSGGHPGGRLP